MQIPWRLLNRRLKRHWRKIVISLGVLSAIAYGTYTGAKNLKNRPVELEFSPEINKVLIEKNEKDPLMSIKFINEYQELLKKD